MGGGRPQVARLSRAVLGLLARRGRFRVLALWSYWESLAMWLWRVGPVRRGAILQFGRSPFRGRSTVLADGTRVMRGDPILHLHLDNRVAESLRSTASNAWQLARVLAGDLDELAKRVNSGELGEVRALRGVTVLAPAAARLGFEVRPLRRTLATAAVRQLAALVLVAYDPHGVERLERGLPWPSEIWMSRDSLVDRLKAQSSGSVGRREGQDQVGDA